MNTQDWLTLMEYSAKFRVSLSTLRRRIKAGEIEYKFSDGKYLLRDGPLVAASPEEEPIAPPSSVSAQKPATESNVIPLDQNSDAADHDQYWRTTNTLLAEIKKAYSLVLQEKEEQILQLKEEVADLKTLVRVLEDETTRLKGRQPASLDFDLGLEV